MDEIEILSKDVEIEGEVYILSSNIEYRTNCITEISTSISVDEDGKIDTNTSWSERFKSKSSLSIHGIEVPYNLFYDYSNRMSKAILKIPFPFSFRLDLGTNSDLNLNSARDQIIYDEKWLIFEENLYRIICMRLKEILGLSDWIKLNKIIQKKDEEIEYSGAAEPPVRCSPSQSTDGIDPLLFCLVKDGRMWQRLSRLP